MSLILEALRKSEAERQRDGTPNVAMELPPVPVRGDGATPGWVWPTLAVVVVGAVLAGWLGMRAGKRDHASNVAAAPATETPAPAPQASAPVPPAITPAPAPQVAVAPAPAVVSAPPQPTVIAPQPPQPAALPQAAAAAPPPAAAPPRLPPPAALPPSPPPAPARAAAAPAEAEDAPPIASTGLPTVKLSMHMWDADPGKRFVIIDGQRMGEGDRSGGLQVIAIRRDGVIVERNGLRAKVPLP